MPAELRNGDAGASGSEDGGSSEEDAEAALGIGEDGAGASEESESDEDAAERR